MSFRINYGQVIGQANEIENLSRELNDQINALNNIFNSIGTDWSGPASNEFRRKLSALIENINHTKSSMSNVSSTIRYVATEIQKEDERQEELARQLAAAQAAAAAEEAKKRMVNHKEVKT